MGGVYDSYRNQTVGIQSNRTTSCAQLGRAGLVSALSDIYRRFRSGEISPSEGERQFHAAVGAFQTNNENLKLSDRIIQNHAELWKRIESAASNYVLSGNRTPEADMFMEAVYGCKLKKEGD